MTDSFNWKEARFLDVPLTEDEVRARGEQLADAVDRREKTLVDHATTRKRLNTEKAAADAEVKKIAGIVRTRREERLVDIECRPNIPLDMVEEVRLDTGQVIETRQLTTHDKERFQLHFFPPPQKEE